MQKRGHPFPNTLLVTLQAVKTWSEWVAWGWCYSYNTFLPKQLWQSWGLPRSHTACGCTKSITCHCQQEIQDCYICIMYASSFVCFAHSSHWTALCGRSDENTSTQSTSQASILWTKSSSLSEAITVNLYSLLWPNPSHNSQVWISISIWSSMPSCYL